MSRAFPGEGPHGRAVAGWGAGPPQYHRGMTSFLEKLSSKFINPVPHMRATGLRIDDIGPSRGTMSLPARPEWLGDPTRGLMHPGALTVLADSACGLAVGAAIQKKAPYATLDLRMDYLRSAGPELDTHCAAECYRLARHVAFVRADVWQERRDEPIPPAQATFMMSTAATRRPDAAPAADNLIVPGAPMPPEAPPGAEAAAAPWTPPAASDAIDIGQPLPYVEFLGIRRAPGSPTLFRLPFQDKLIGNPMLPALHGGVVAGFAETAATLHLIVHLKGAKFPKSVDFSIDYLRSGRPQETFASSEIVRVGSRVALVQTRCWQRSPDYPIAVTRAHFLLTDPEDSSE